MRAILAAVVAFAVVAPTTEPKPWQRETWLGTVEIESNTWGGFGKKTFALWVDGERGFSSVSEDLAFATESEYRASDRLADCSVEVTGFRVRRADASWIVVETIRERSHAGKH